MSRSRIAVASVILPIPYASFLYALFSEPRPAQSELEVTVPSVERPPQPRRTIEVSQRATGGFTTISSAVQFAQPGDRVLVKSGIYNEEVVIERP